jgi:AcrR family transcriptional regulator
VSTHPARPAVAVEADQRRAPRKRDEEVVAAAAKVFYARGYADATVQGVADELGILKGSLYHYIDAKEDLLFRLFEQVHVDVEGIIDEVASAEGVDALERLSRYVRLQVVHNLGDLERISIYYHELDRLGPERRASIVAWRRVHERFVASLIGEAQDAGLADASVDARLLSNCVFAAIIWPYHWYRAGADGDVAAVADACVEYVLRGVTGG